MDKETPGECQSQGRNAAADSGDCDSSNSSSKITSNEDINNKLLVSETVVDAEVGKVRSLSISERLNGNDTHDEHETLRNDECLTPGTSDSDPLLLKRSSRSHSRNYRNHHSLNNSLAEESSNDSSENRDKKETEDSKHRSNESKRPNEEVPESDPDSPLSKYMKHGDEDSRQSETSEPRSSSTTSGPDTSSHHEDEDDNESGSPSRFFRMISSDEGHEDSENDEDEARGSIPESPHHEPHGFDSSSSDSVVFEDEGSSSSSSDNYLEDLDDTVESQDRETGTTNQESSVRTPSRQNKKKTDSKKKNNSEPPKVLTKPKAKELWIGPREFRKRELGYNGRQQSQTAELFRSGFYGSLFSAERLELMKKLEGHHGCVNCLNFNFSGTKLASGSDDLSIKIWNYGIGKCITSFQSGHRANVFQAKFVPFIGMDSVIVSCARDNQVRLNELSSSGEVRSSKKLAQHRGPAHKLSLSPESPHVILSCGEDSFVFSIDIREDCYTRLLNVRENGKKVSLYSIHQNPFAPYEFCVSGKDQFVRIYDTRKLHSVTSTASLNSSVDSDAPPENSNSNSPVKKFCPHHLIDPQSRGTQSPFDKTNVTAAVYSYNGREVLASYNDENIYLFDSSHSDMADYIKKYEGHRNSATVKGVNFYGDRSQFIVSGSDCGHVFLWDKESESIVNFFRGDESGVVNCLESHPAIPILATSGLDDDVKIWIPSQEKPPKMTDLASTVKRNIRKREEQAKENSDSDGFIMWALINQMRRSRRRRRQAGELSDSDYSPFESDDDGDGSGGSGLGVECSIC